MSSFRQNLYSATQTHLLVTDKEPPAGGSRRSSSGDPEQTLISPVVQEDASRRAAVTQHGHDLAASKLTAVKASFRRANTFADCFCPFHGAAVRIRSKVFADLVHADRQMAVALVFPGLELVARTCPRSRRRHGRSTWRSSRSSGTAASRRDRAARTYDWPLSASCTLLARSSIPAEPCAQCLQRMASAPRVAT